MDDPLKEFRSIGPSYLGTIDGAVNSRFNTYIVMVSKVTSLKARYFTFPFDIAKIQRKLNALLWFRIYVYI